MVTLLAAVPVAGAHAQIDRSDPASGARLGEAPASVELALTQPVEQSTTTLEVTDQDGARVDAGEIQWVRGGDRPVLRKALIDDVPDGAYLIKLTATSITDGHRITYTVGFAVGGFVPPASDLASADEMDARGALGRILAYAGLALVLGGLVLAWRLDARPQLLGAVRSGAVLHLAGAVVLADAVRSDGGQSWGAFVDTSIGGAMALRIAGALVLALAAAVLRGWTRPAWIAAWTGLLVSLVTTARFTHASIEGPLAIANDLVHLVSAGTWVGGLVLLLRLLRDPARDPLRDARRFSRIAFPAVVALAVTGVVSSLLIIDPAVRSDPRTLLASRYGAALAGKVALALAMVGLAGLNRYVLLHDPSQGARGRMLRRVATPLAWLRPGLSGDAARRAQRRLVGTEAAMGAIVIVLAGVLLSVSPPEPAAAQANEGLRAAGAGDDVLVTAFLDPVPVVGATSTMRFYLEYAPDFADAPGQPIANNTCGRSSCITVHVDVPGVEGGEAKAAEPEGDGWWLVDLLWSRSGHHALTVDVQTELVFRDRIVLDVPVG